MNFYRHWVVFFLALMLFIPPVGLAGPTEKPSPLHAAQNSVFGLLVNGHLSGSGVVISSDGLVLTAAHQVKDIEAPIEARSRILGRLTLERLAIDAGADIALMKLPDRDGGYPYVSLASHPAKVTEAVYLIGSPIYRHNLYHRGHIASQVTNFEYLPRQKYYAKIRYVIGASPPGTSGGPWLNENGELVGIQVGLMHDQMKPVQIAYMSPLERIRQLVQSVRTVSTATLFLGLEEFWEQDDEYRSQYPTQQEGLVIAHIHAGLGVDQSQLNVGDLIVSVDEKAVTYRQDLLQAVRRKKPGNRVVLNILGPDGQIRRVDMILGRI